MRMAQRDIIKLKMTNINKSTGKPYKNGNIGLYAIDVKGKHHYLKHVAYDFAIELIECAYNDELELDFIINTGKE